MLHNFENRLTFKEVGQKLKGNNLTGMFSGARPTIQATSGNIFNRKPTIGRTVATVETNNDTHYLQKRIKSTR